MQSLQADGLCLAAGWLACTGLRDRCKAFRILAVRRTGQSGSLSAVPRQLEAAMLSIQSCNNGERRAPLFVMPRYYRPQNSTCKDKQRSQHLAEKDLYF